MLKKTLFGKDLYNPNEIYNWIKQHKNTFNKFKDVKFYKVNPEDEAINVTVDEWKDCDNLEYITLQDTRNLNYSIIR